MFSHNLRRLAHLPNIVPQITTAVSKSSKSLQNAGRICVVLLPTSVTNSFQPITVQCFSTNSSQSNLLQSRKNNNNPEMAEATEDYKKATSIYDFSVKDTFGNDVSLDKYRGNVVLIVNIASKCGLTKDNYKELTELKEKYFDKGLRILNFPCNQFNSQMPEADGEEMVCHLKSAKADIGDVFEKIDVNGSGAHPLYKFLKDKQGGTFGDGIKWNFTKFLVDKEGKPVNRYAPTTKPLEIAKDIEKLL